MKNLQVGISVKKLKALLTLKGSLRKQLGNKLISGGVPRSGLGAEGKVTSPDLLSSKSNLINLEDTNSFESFH
ncbi:MAG: hypothetical protein H7Y04_09945 [Verrucomicrobia bacterium]|nr:hypothetical protein [Cytophagales bacterium]